LRKAYLLIILVFLAIAFEAVAESPTTGSPDAKVTIIEYSDYACIPYCAKAHETMKELLKEYSGKIRLIYKYYPLTRIHPWGVDAAVDAACIHKQDQALFWKVSDYLFAHQAEIKSETLPGTVLDFAKANGLDVARLNTCMMDLTTLPAIKADLIEAQQKGLTGTPVFIINGKTITGAQPKEEFARVIDEALSAQN
jgi:protein-disulfide isomerase